MTMTQQELAGIKFQLRMKTLGHAIAGTASQKRPDPAAVILAKATVAAITGTREPATIQANKPISAKCWDVQTFTYSPAVGEETKLAIAWTASMQALGYDVLHR